VVLREIDFVLKICKGFLACFTCGVNYINTEMCKFESSQKDEIRSQSADSSIGLR